jgi:hypothetical protein
VGFTSAIFSLGGGMIALLVICKLGPNSISTLPHQWAEEVLIESATRSTTKFTAIPYKLTRQCHVSH